MTSPALDVERLRFSYPGGPQVLDIPRLVIGRGERVFLRGPSGSGKSTLLGVVSGVLPAGEGKVESLGRDLAALSPAERDAFRGDHIGLIFQMFNLLSYLSVPDNVLLPARFSALRRSRCSPSPQAEAARLLTALGLAPRAASARSVAEMSIGEQQRVAVARALLGRPELVIADEPTSALDSETRDAFLRLLMAECANAGAALLFVSHDTALGPHFDRQLSITGISGDAPPGEPR